jgi:hypothetical protein
MKDQEIIDNAPEGATHIEDNSNLYIKVLPRVTSTIFNDWFIFEIDQWIIIDTYNVLLMRSLADIKRILELENEKLTLCKSELETYALVMANARRLIKANVRTSNGRLFSEIFGTGFGTGRDSARSLGLNPDCNKTDYNQMRRHIDLEELKEH